MRGGGRQKDTQAFQAPWEVLVTHSGQWEGQRLWEQEVPGSDSHWLCDAGQSPCLSEPQ